MDLSNLTPEEKAVVVASLTIYAKSFASWNPVAYKEIASVARKVKEAYDKDETNGRHTTRKVLPQGS